VPRATTPHLHPRNKSKRWWLIAEPHYGIWFNNRRLLEPIGNIPPAEAEAAYYAQLEVIPMAA
jgi:transposase InsO family protein